MSCLLRAMAHIMVRWEMRREQRWDEDLQGKHGELRKKPVPTPLCPTVISLQVTRDLTGVSAGRNHGPTAWPTTTAIDNKRTVQLLTATTCSKKVKYSFEQLPNSTECPLTRAWSLVFADALEERYKRLYLPSAERKITHSVRKPLIQCKPSAVIISDTL